MAGPKRVNLTGKKFGRLAAIRDAGKAHSNGSRLWVCHCDCGNIVEIPAAALNNWQQRSCGCLRSEAGRKKRLPGGEAGFNALYRSYKNDQRRYEFSLPKEEFRKLTSSPCHYCGSEPRQEKKSHSKSGAAPYIYNGIDRVDNTKGHVPGNCVPCCGICNRMKGSMSRSEFLYAVSRIEKYHKSKFQRRSK